MAETKTVKIVIEVEVPVEATYVAIDDTGAIVYTCGGHLTCSGDQMTPFDVSNENIWVSSRNDIKFGEVINWRETLTEVK